MLDLLVNTENKNVKVNLFQPSAFPGLERQGIVEPGDASHGSMLEELVSVLLLVENGHS